MYIKKNIPNFITSLNLLSGCLAVVFVFEGHLHVAAMLVLAASVFDFADGFAARLLNAYSPMGKELDSLADLVSFGMAPAAIVYSLMKQAPPDTTWLVEGLNIWPFTAFLITIFSAIRLAVFNVDDRQSDSFIGLPTPANALFFISFPLVIWAGSPAHYLHPYFNALTTNFNVLLALTLLFSFLLVSPFHLFSLKFKNLSFKDNRTRFIFIILSALLVIMTGFFALPFIIILYIILSLLSAYR